MGSIGLFIILKQEGSVFCKAKKLNTMSLLYTNNKDEDIVNMIAAEVSHWDDKGGPPTRAHACGSLQHIFRPCTNRFSPLIVLGSRRNSELQLADVILRLRPQPGWCLLHELGQDLGEDHGCRQNHRCHPGEQPQGRPRKCFKHSLSHTQHCLAPNTPSSALVAFVLI